MVLSCPTTEQSEKPGKRPNKPSRAKLSKKEKKFQLQKDDGTYTELQPIDPQDAKRQFGESLRLNPVGPAFVANRASNSQDTQTHTAHNADQMVEDSSFMGSYYVLEIGNFDEAGAEISRPETGKFRKSRAVGTTRILHAGGEEL